MPEPASKEKRSKWGLFHSRDNPNSTSTNHTPDSAYGSSEPSISEGTSAATAPSLSESTHGNRNTYDPSVVTTTTTTTTTTTSGGGPQSSTTSQRSTDPSNDRNSYSERDGPPIPIKSSMRDRSPNPQSPQTAPGLAAPGDRSPMTTQGSNYSYPSRTPPPVNPANPPHAARDPPTSTLQGFKSAAAGIHGAGETLRGTVNSAVDRRFGAPADTLAAHDRVTNAGRQEIETGHLTHQHAPPVGVGAVRKGILRKKVDDREGRFRVVDF